MNARTMAESKSGWIKIVDEKLRADLDLAAHAAYKNGCDLSNDARLLLDSNRYSRATALAILAEEEFCKAFTLKLSAFNGRWDSNIYNSLRSHAIKQGIAQAVLNYVDWEKAKSASSFFYSSVYPDEHKVRELVDEAKAQVSKKVKDRLKQDALYVSINKEGKLQSLPSELTREDAEKTLLNTDRFQTNVAILLGEKIEFERFFNR